MKKSESKSATADLNNNKLPAYWVTGFSDAESSFSVRIAETTKKTG